MQEGRKLTAPEKEAMIMKEIRSNKVNYEKKFGGSFLGNFFDFAIKRQDSSVAK